MQWNEFPMQWNTQCNEICNANELWNAINYAMSWIAQCNELHNAINNGINQFFNTMSNATQSII